MHGARKRESIKHGEQHPNFKDGRYTHEAKLAQSATSLRLQQLENLMHLLGMTSAPRSRGRKANGYYKITSLDEIKEMT
jgi:hypothetical protein